MVNFFQGGAYFLVVLQTSMAKLSVGISLNVDSTQTLGAAEFLKLRGETCICAVACIIDYILLRFSKQFWEGCRATRLGMLSLL